MGYVLYGADGSGSCIVEAALAAPEVVGAANGTAQTRASLVASQRLALQGPDRQKKPPDQNPLFLVGTDHRWFVGTKPDI